VNLDIATLGIALVVVFSGNLYFSVLLHRRRQRFPGDSQWIAGLALLFGGFLLKAFDPSTPDFWHDVLANTLILTSMVLFAHSVWRFRRGWNFPLAWYALVPVAFLALWGVLSRGFHWELFTFDALLAVGSLIPAMLFFSRSSEAQSRPLRVVAFPFVGLSLLSGAGAAWNFPNTGETGLMTMTGYNAWFYLGALLMGSITSFGYFLLGSLHYSQMVDKRDLEISRQTEVLREQNRTKDLFFSIIAHDLRGPISGAARYTRKHLLGKMTGLEHKYREVETLAASLDRTNEYLEKLLWWSRTQLRDWVPSWTEVNLEKVFAETGRMLAPLAAAKSISVEFPALPPVQVMADEECVTLILVNLLTNAVKFSHPGSVVSVETARARSSFELTVVDQGVGMDEATQERLFRIENKLSTPGTLGEAGSGMGLILAQTLAQRNNGGLEIRSQPGAGTRVTFWLPLRLE
jgi:signal transduction histidine kinase